MVCRTSALTADTGKRWHSHRLRLVSICSSQVAVRGVVSPLLLWCLGLGVVRDCSVSCRDCVAPASLDDACRCMSPPSQGLRWAFGQTSPLPSRVTTKLGHMHFSCRYQAVPHRLIFGQSLISSFTRASISRPPVDMGTSKASKRRQANRPGGRRERAAERGGAPTASGGGPCLFILSVGRSSPGFDGDYTTVLVR